MENLNCKKSFGKIFENGSRTSLPTSSNNWQEKIPSEIKRELEQRRDPNVEKEGKSDGLIFNKMVKKEEDQAQPMAFSQSNISHQQYQSSHQPVQQQLQTISGQPPLSSMTPAFPTYAYNVNENYSMDQQSYSFMNQYNVPFYTMNPQWPSNQMDNFGLQSTGMQGTTTMPVSTNMEMAPTTSTSNYPYYMPMSGDIYGMMGNFPSYPMYNQEMMSPVKETITLSSCVLYPPHPGQHIKRRERHPGCRTVFVGGLPEKISEEIIREIFSRCGEITTVRMSKKNFCHVRFAKELYVDEAMKLSGYRLKIENKDESAYSGRLHVDYARARDDEYDYECYQRALQREARHRERLEQEALRPPTPPPVVHYSEHEANLLSDKLKSEEHFKAATHVLITWLERGECNRKTCGSFYSMIQCTNSHIKRLLNEKTNIQEKLNESQIHLTQKMRDMSGYLIEIFKIFKVIQESPNILDSFSKSQRKEIDNLREKISDIITTHSNEALEERVEDAMEISDDEENIEKPPEKPVESKKRPPKVTKEEVQKLREQVEEARSRYQKILEQTASIRNGIDLQCKTSTQILQDMQEKISAKEAEIEELQNFKDNYLATVSHVAEPSQSCEIEEDQIQLCTNEVIISQHETHLIALIATFLNVHPFGENIKQFCLIKICRNYSALIKHDKVLVDALQAYH